MPLPALPSPTVSFTMVLDITSAARAGFRLDKTGAPGHGTKMSCEQLSNQHPKFWLTSCNFLGICFVGANTPLLLERLQNRPASSRGLWPVWSATHSLRDRQHPAKPATSRIVGRMNISNKACPIPALDCACLPGYVLVYRMVGSSPEQTNRRRKPWQQLLLFVSRLGNGLGKSATILGSIVSL